MISRDDLIAALNAIEKDIYDMEFNDCLKKLDEPTREHIVSLREQVVIFKTKLQAARLEEIAGKLETYEDDLRSGLNDLDEEAQELAKFRKALDGLDKLVKVGVKIFGVLA